MSKPNVGGSPTITLPPALGPDDIRELLANPGQVALVAQPIVDLLRGTVVGYEMLARFTLKSGKPSYPDKVFAAAGLCGLGPELESVVVQRALDLARTKPVGMFITINIDPHHIVEPIVAEVLANHGDLAGLIFELTEHREIADLRAVRRGVDGLRRRGAMIAIDDAGAGYSGLKQILELGPQVIKIDRDLVTDLQSSEAKRTLIHMLCDLAARLDAWVLAEGIETEAELNALLALGVTLGQGYYLGKPLPPWSELGEEPSASLTRSGHHRRMSSPAGGSAGTVMEPPTICKGDDEWPVAARVAVRVDRTTRPIEMRLHDDDGMRLRLEYDLLRVNVETSIAAVAIRALTRPEHLRWDPLVCIDERGQIEGVLPMQRIVSALANQVLKAADETPPPPRESSVPIITPTRH